MSTELVEPIEDYRLATQRASRYGEDPLSNVLKNLSPQQAAVALKAYRLAQTGREAEVDAEGKKVWSEIFTRRDVVRQAKRNLMRHEAAQINEFRERQQQLQDGNGLFGTVWRAAQEFSEIAVGALTGPVKGLAGMAMLPLEAANLIEQGKTREVMEAADKIPQLLVNDPLGAVLPDVLGIHTSSLESTGREVFRANHPYLTGSAQVLGYAAPILYMGLGGLRGGAVSVPGLADESIGLWSHLWQGGAIGLGKFIQRDGNALRKFVGGAIYGTAKISHRALAPVSNLVDRYVYGGVYADRVSLAFARRAALKANRAGKVAGATGKALTPAEVRLLSLEEAHSLREQFNSSVEWWAETFARNAARSGAFATSALGEGVGDLVRDVPFVGSMIPEGVLGDFLVDFGFGFAFEAVPTFMTLRRLANRTDDIGRMAEQSLRDSTALIPFDGPDNIRYTLADGNGYVVGPGARGAAEALEDLHRVGVEVNFIMRGGQVVGPARVNAFRYRGLPKPYALVPHPKGGGFGLPPVGTKELPGGVMRGAYKSVDQWAQKLGEEIEGVIQRANQAIKQGRVNNPQQLARALQERVHAVAEAGGLPKKMVEDIVFDFDPVSLEINLASRTAIVTDYDWLIREATGAGKVKLLQEGASPLREVGRPLTVQLSPVHSYGPHSLQDMGRWWELPAHTQQATGVSARRLTGRLGRLRKTLSNYASVDTPIDRIPEPVRHILAEADDFGLVQLMSPNNSRKGAEWLVGNRLDENGWRRPSYAPEGLSQFDATGRPDWAARELMARWAGMGAGEVRAPVKPQQLDLLTGAGALKKKKKPALPTKSTPTGDATPPSVVKVPSGPNEPPPPAPLVVEKELPIPEPKVGAEAVAEQVRGALRPAEESAVEMLTKRLGATKAVATKIVRSDPRGVAKQLWELIPEKVQSALSGRPGGHVAALLLAVRNEVDNMATQLGWTPLEKAAAAAGLNKDFAKQIQWVKDAAARKEIGTFLIPDDQFITISAGHKKFATGLSRLVEAKKMTAGERELLKYLFKDAPGESLKLIDIKTTNPQIGGYGMYTSKVDVAGAAEDWAATFKKGILQISDTVVNAETKRTLLRNIEVAARRTGMSSSELLNKLFSHRTVIDAIHGDAVSTFLHEYAHHGWYATLTPAEKQQVVKIFESMDEPSRFNLFLPDAEASGMKKEVQSILRGRASTYSKAPDEFFAEAFSDWMMYKASINPQLDGVFQRLYRKMKTVIKRFFDPKLRVNPKTEQIQKDLEPYFKKIMEEPPPPGNRMPELADGKFDYFSMKPKANEPKVFRTFRGRLREVRKLYTLGEDMKGWYKGKDAGFIVEAFGDDADVFVQLIAATSKGASVDAGLTQALNVYKKWKRGTSVEDIVNASGKGAIGLAKKEVEAILTGQKWDGQKIADFLSALHMDEDAVVVDRWMARAFGLKKIAPTAKEYQEIARLVRQEAAAIGVTPAEYQAAVWTGMKRKVEGAGTFVEEFNTTVRKRLANYQLDLFNNDPLLEVVARANFKPTTENILERDILYHVNAKDDNYLFTSVAMKLEDGQILTPNPGDAPTHIGLYRYIPEGYDANKVIDGFVDSKGKFYDRREAAKLASERTAGASDTLMNEVAVKKKGGEWELALEGESVLMGEAGLMRPPASLEGGITGARVGREGGQMQKPVASTASLFDPATRRSIDERLVEMDKMLGGEGVSPLAGLTPNDVADKLVNNERFSLGKGESRVVFKFSDESQGFEFVAGNKEVFEYLNEDSLQSLGNLLWEALATPF